MSDTFGPIMGYYTVPRSKDQNESNKVFVLNTEDTTNLREKITEEEFNTIKDKVPYTIFTFEIDEDDDEHTEYGLMSVIIENA